MNFRNRAQIHTAGGLVDDGDQRLAGQSLGEYDLLLISTAQLLEGGLAGREGADLELVDEPLRQRLPGTRVSDFPGLGPEIPQSGVGDDRVEPGLITDIGSFLRCSHRVRSPTGMDRPLVAPGIVTESTIRCDRDRQRAGIGGHGLPDGSQATIRFAQHPDVRRTCATDQEVARSRRIIRRGRACRGSGNSADGHSRSKLIAITVVRIRARRIR